MTCPCARCATMGRTCCSGYQILLTAGDRSRIFSFTGNFEFETFEIPSDKEFTPDYDPDWVSFVCEPDKRIRVLRRNADNACIFLSKTGCRLAAEQRPLICRIYPYTFTENGVLGIDPACPISREENWQTVLFDMQMPVSKAGEWLGLLYSEVRTAKNSCSVSTTA